MIKCVIKGTTITIDGSENSTQTMLQNAQNAGYSESTIEILTEEEYDARKALEPNPEGEITSLKAQLTETDYKIIKCSEYQLAGLELPYDIATLHADRQNKRTRINELELTL